MNEISQVSVVTPQQRSKKHALTAVGCAGTLGVATGLGADRLGKKMIEEATRATDETLIRKNLADFYYKGNPVPEGSKEFFEKAVKDKVALAERNLKSVKEMFKGFGAVIGASVALGTLAVWGVSKVIGAMLSSHNKEN
jgi:hypothetical protein